MSGKESMDPVHNYLCIAHENGHGDNEMHYLKLRDELWSLLVQKLEQRFEELGRNYSNVARQIGVPTATVTRWIKGERGGKVSLLYALQIIDRLGVPMEDVISILSPGVVAELLEALARRPELVKEMLAVIKGGSDDDLEKIEQDLKWVKSKINKP